MEGNTGESKLKFPASIPIVEQREIPKEVTPEYAAKLLLWSFYFSQGDPGLQTELLRYIHELHPDLKVDKAFQEQLAAACYPLIRKYIEGAVKEGLHRPFVEVEEDRPEDDPVKAGVNAEINKFIKVFKDREGLAVGREKILPDLASGMISRDYYFIPGYPLSGARYRTPPAGNQSKTHTVMRDRNLSQFCHYVLLGNSIGVPEFDEMFVDIRKYVASSSFDELLDDRGISSIKELAKDVKLRRALKEVIKKFNTTHPETFVDFNV